MYFDPSHPTDVNFLILLCIILVSLLGYGLLRLYQRMQERSATNKKIDPTYLK